MTLFSHLLDVYISTTHKSLQVQLHKLFLVTFLSSFNQRFLNIFRYRTSKFTSYNYSCTIAIYNCKLHFTTAEIVISCTLKYALICMYYRALWLAYANAIQTIYVYNNIFTLWIQYFREGTKGGLTCTPWPRIFAVTHNWKIILTFVHFSNLHKTVISVLMETHGCSLYANNQVIHMPSVYNPSAVSLRRGGQ